MLEQINNFLKRIFSNEETIVFSFLIISILVFASLFGSVLSVFIISAVTAYLLVGLQKNIQKYNLSEFQALLITYMLFLITGILILVILIPILSQQLQLFIQDAPRLINGLVDFIVSIPASYPDLISSDQISSFFESFSSELTSITQNIVQGSLSGIQSTIEILIYIILFPILVYFFLFDRKEILDGLVKAIPGKTEMLSKVWVEMDVQLSNYVRGKALEIVIVAVASALIFTIFGLKYTALLAVLVGFSVLIPYIGAFLVTIPIAIVGFLQFGMSIEFGILMGLYLILQFIDGNLLVPIIFSSAVKLHPVVIILAVFIFGNMFGFWGVFFAIPIATFIKAVWNAWPSQFES